jgi:hypothetical protein
LTENVVQNYFVYTMTVVIITIVLRICRFEIKFERVCFILSDEVVLYKGIECKIFWNYGNGYYEIIFLKEVLLVHESEITKPAPLLKDTSQVLRSPTKKYFC